MLVLVKWEGLNREEVTWEDWVDLHKVYPRLNGPRISCLIKQGRSIRFGLHELHLSCPIRPNRKSRFDLTLVLRNGVMTLIAY